MQCSPPGLWTAKKKRQNPKYLQEIARKGLWGRDQEEAPSFWNMGDSDDWRIHMSPRWDQTKASFSQKSVSFLIVICEYSLSCPNPGQFLTSVPWALMIANTSVCMTAVALITATVTLATLWMKTRRHVQVKMVPLSLIHALGQEWAFLSPSLKYSFESCLLVCLQDGKFLLFHQASFPPLVFKGTSTLFSVVNIFISKWRHSITRRWSFYLCILGFSLHCVKTVWLCIMENFWSSQKHWEQNSHITIT